jgi:uncharacterized repeat protein (TIGR03803 family)
MNRSHGALAQLVCVTILSLAGCGGGSSPRSSPSPPPPSSTYTVGGNVSGLGATDSVTLLNNGGDALTVSRNGGFMFSTRQNVGDAYAVTVQSHTPGVACSVGNGSGSGASSDVTSVTVSCALGTLSIVYSFGSGGTDGMSPQASLIMDSAGNLYGTTYAGGTTGVGTVFKIRPDGTESILHSFAGPPTDGGNPQASLVMDSAGNLYGTTSLGGSNNVGTVFKISSDGTESVLHAFSGSAPDVGYPRAGLIMDSAGNLYGTSAAGNGTVFKIDAAGTESVLYAFAGEQSDGSQPFGGLIMDGAGNLYGTTSTGGSVGNDGTVFQITPAGTENILHSFVFVAFSGAATDGGEPFAGLIADKAGNLYGTTSSGGADKEGTVFKVSPAGTESIVYFFSGGATDGAEPYAGLTIDGAGNLYGTTIVGGASGGANGEGTVFKVRPNGSETVLHFFTGGSTDGNSPYGGLIMDSAGNLYGTTAGGGANGEGTVFKID